MLGSKRILLKALISKQFSKGINKTDLFNALENFIDKQYPEKTGDGVYMTHSIKAKILLDLAMDIKQARGLELWKKKLMLLNTPIVGSLPKKKKQNQSK